MPLPEDMLCGGCAQPITDNSDKVICSQCRKHFHASCVAASRGDSSASLRQSKPSWLCPSCKPKSSNADNTPVRASSAGHRSNEESNVTQRKKATAASISSTKTGSDGPLTASAVRDIVKEEFKNLLKQLNDKLSISNRELKSIKDEISGMKDSMKFMNDQYEEMRTELRSKCNNIEELHKENSQLKTKVGELSLRVNLMEQHARSCNVEIQCLPECKGENLVSTVTNLSKVISCGISESNIHKVTRIAKQNHNNTRPKSIIVQFNSPRMRDEFLAASIKYNKNNPDSKLNSHTLGIGGAKQNVYIMEHLSPENKSLHAAARMKAKEKGYRFVWIRNGKIFMRKTETSDYKYIKDKDTLDKLE